MMLIYKQMGIKTEICPNETESIRLWHQIELNKENYQYPALMAATR